MYTTVRTDAMSSVGVRELRNGLSRYLATVQNGESITVTEHGRPIARIVPASGPSALDRLIAAGLATPPADQKRPSSEPIHTRGTVSDLIAEQRR
jgi:prevent-host-death family protein